MDIRRVLIVGAGTLGGQVGFQCATHGFDTVMFDVSATSLEACRRTHRALAEMFVAQGRRDRDAIEAALARITYTGDLAAACRDVDLLNESVPENLQIKQDVYAQLQRHCPAHTIFTTNTSTLLPSQLAEASGRPARFLALHFANEIWDRNIGEVMGHPGTDPAVYERVAAFAQEIGMVPIRLEKEQNGYVINSLLVPWVTAAQTLVTNGVSTPELVDKTWMITMNTKIGPFGIMDIVGLETVYNITAHWGSATGNPQLLKNAEYVKSRFVDAGQLGVKTGQGYYRYPDPAYAAPGFLR